MGTTSNHNTTFEKCYQDLPDERRSLLDDLLDNLKKDPEQNKQFKLWTVQEIPSSKIGDTIVRNLEEEHFLDVPRMETLLNKMIDIYQDFTKNPGGDDHTTFLGTFMARIEAELLYHPKNTLQFKGEIIKQVPQYIGTAIPEDRLVIFLLKNYAVFEGDPDNVRKVLDNFELYKDDKRYKDFLIREANRLIWFTWSPNNHEDPLRELTCDCADDVCNALALNMHGLNNNNLYFITFKQSDTLTIRKPTFCDAGFGHYFRPPPPDFKKHGLTQPLLNGVPRLPEGVGRSQSCTFSQIHEIRFHKCHT